MNNPGRVKHPNVSIVTPGSIETRRNDDDIYSYWMLQIYFFAKVGIVGTRARVIRNEGTTDAVVNFPV